MNSNETEPEIAVSTVVDIFKAMVVILLATPFLTGIGIPQFVGIGAAMGMAGAIVAIFITVEDAQDKMADALFATTLITLAMMVAISVGASIAVALIGLTFGSAVGVVFGMFAALFAYMLMDTPQSKDEVSVLPSV